MSNQGDDEQPIESPRRWTTLPFPAYSYVPGQHPHPTSHVDGHSHGQPEPVATDFHVEQWQACSTFLFGIDLFNAGFFWESHEQWEAVWNALGRIGAEADFVKGLIKLAASKVKTLEGKPVGSARHAKRAAELFASVQQTTETLCGLNLATLCQWAQKLEQNAEYEFTLKPQLALDAHRD